MDGTVYYPDKKEHKRLLKGMSLDEPLDVVEDMPKTKNELKQQLKEKRPTRPNKHRRMMAKIYKKRKKG